MRGLVEWACAEYRRAQGPTMWLISADKLKASADEIFGAALNQECLHREASEVAGMKARELFEADPTQRAVVEIACDEPRFLPSFLLYGYAIENLLKGLYVQKHPEAIGDDRVLLPAHHGLRSLAFAVGYVATKDEEDVLEKLTTITTWSGRYPVAKTVQSHRSNREGIFDDAFKAGEAIRDLYGRLRGMLDPTGRPGGGGGAIVVFIPEEPNK